VFCRALYLSLTLRARGRGFGEVVWVRNGLWVRVLFIPLELKGIQAERAGGCKTRFIALNPPTHTPLPSRPHFSSATLRRPGLLPPEEPH
jgi:hypothetical protein